MLSNKKREVLPVLNAITPGKEWHYNTKKLTPWLSVSSSEEANKICEHFISNNFSSISSEKENDSIYWKVVIQSPDIESLKKIPIIKFEAKFLCSKTPG